MSPEIRPARLAEAAKIAGLSRRVIEHGLPWRWRPRVVATHIRDSESAVVVARANDRLLGFAIMGFRFLHREAHLLLLAVEPAARRQRVGLTLWRWLETIARRGGIATVALEIREGNSGARSFYQTLGFRTVARLHGYYDGREDAQRMMADLRSHGSTSALSVPQDQARPARAGFRRVPDSSIPTPASAGPDGDEA